MSDLTNLEKRKFERLLAMGDGTSQTARLLNSSSTVLAAIPTTVAMIMEAPKLTGCAASGYMKEIL
jgi:hypothetical protein